MCYNKNNLLFQLVANNMYMFPKIILNQKTLKLYTSLSALKESVQIDYKKACCYRTSMNTTFWTISWNWSILPKICQKTRWFLMFSENTERDQWQKKGYKHSWQRVSNPPTIWRTSYIAYSLPCGLQPSLSLFFLLSCFFSWNAVSMIWYHTQKHKQYTQGPINWHNDLLTPPVMCSQQLSTLHWMNNSMISKLYFPQRLFICKSNISVIRCNKLSSSCETQIILIEMIYINKPHTYIATTQQKVTLEREIKISNTPFFKTTPYFTNPSLFMQKIWNPSPFLWKFQTQTPP